MLGPVHHQRPNLTRLLNHDTLDSRDLLTKDKKGQFDTHVAYVVQSASEGDFLADHVLGDGGDVDSLGRVARRRLHKRHVAVSLTHFVGLNPRCVFQSLLGPLLGIIAMLKAEPRSSFLLLLLCGKSSLLVLAYAIAVEVASIGLVVTRGVSSFVDMQNLGETASMRTLGPVTCGRHVTAIAATVMVAIRNMTECFGELPQGVAAA